MASVIFSKSSDVNNSIFGKSQEPVRAVITQGVESFEAKSLLSTVYSMDTSTSFAPAGITTRIAACILM